MSTLASSAHYLSEKGLSVIHRSATHLAVKRDGDRVLDIVEVDDRYVVETWETAPGPGEDDFRFSTSTLDDALLATWCFYFADPIELAGWILPIHRRPYWSLAKLQYRVANTVRVTPDQLAGIREKRRHRAIAQASQPARGLAFAECTQFLLAGTRHDSSAQLFVRRDLEEAYVITDPLAIDQP